MKLKNTEATEKHQLVHEGISKVLREHMADAPGWEILAVLAHMVGQVVAFQDQRTMTPAMAMQLVVKNIEAGNQHAMALLDKPEGRA